MSAIRTNVNQVKSGLKYWLSPDGELFHTYEHSQGALDIARRILGQADLHKVGVPDPDNIPETFGVPRLFELGWIRLVTEKSTIWITGKSRTPELTGAQRETIQQMVEQFMAMNRTKPGVLYGDGGSKAGKIAVDLG